MPVKGSNRHVLPNDSFDLTVSGLEKTPLLLVLRIPSYSIPLFLLLSPTISKVTQHGLEIPAEDLGESIEMLY